MLRPKVWLGVSAIWLAAVCGCANADIYRYVDATGKVHFTNVPADSRFKLYIATEKKPSAMTETLAAQGYRPIPKSERSKFHRHVLAAARAFGLEPALIHAVISAESGYNHLARSPRGARGLMQLMPDTARRYGVTNPLDPEQNIQGGAAYLKDLLNLFGDDVQLALAAYNAGEGAVMTHGYRIPPYPETIQYVPKVMAYYKRYQHVM
jgi:soluble lytic murein transglycosylase-like protein